MKINNKLEDCSRNKTYLIKFTVKYYNWLVMFDEIKIHFYACVMKSKRSEIPRASFVQGGKI